MFTRKSGYVIALLVVVALMAVACGPGATPPPVVITAPPVVITAAPIIQTVAPVIQTSAPVVQTVIVAGTPQVSVVTATPPPPKPVPTGPGTKSITVIANWTGGEREAFQAVLDGFTAKTGIQVAYESARDNLEPVVRTRVAGGNPPDVVMEPRPGAMAEFARAGNVIQLDASGKEVVKPADLTAAFGDAYINLGKVDNKLYGLIFKADSKSTFWYKPASLKALGAEPPKTIDQLFAIADKYKAAGKVPFAVGGKDGWVLTDYFENILARTVTPQQYQDLHVTHKLAWTDPGVKKALTTFTKFFQAGYNPGGSQGVLGTGFTDSIAQVFGTNQSAEMFYEGGFVGTIATTTFTNLKPGTDLDFFVFPQVDPAMDDPIVGGGDFAMLMKDTPEGRSFIQYLASKEAAEIFAGTDSISPNKLLDVKKFKSSLRAKEYQTLSTAKTFLFDGSDQAPSSLGGDFEFTELQKLVQNPNNVDQIATELENFAKTAY